MVERRDLPLFAWGEALRTARRDRLRLRRRAALAAFGIACLAATMAAPPAPRLVWNASASAPLGLYRVSPGAPVTVGDMVIAWLPPDARALAAGRHYLPANVPVVKRIAAAPGDTVRASGGVILVNDRPIARRLSRDRLGRAMPWWEGCRRLRRGEVFLLMPASPASFDGRYFGTVSERSVIGKATLLWGR